MLVCIVFFLFSSRRRHTRCALVTGVQTCALPIYAGTPDDPLVIRIETEAATVLMYPNPFSSLINIEGEIHGGDATQTSNTSHRVQLKVYDVTGGLVLERLPERVTGNRFHITWNGRNAGGQSCRPRSEEHTSELQSLMRISYAVFCLKKK